MRDGKNHGRPYRLPDYDYSQNGCYFVTFCTENRVPCLSRVMLTTPDVGRDSSVGRGLAPGMPYEVAIELSRIGALLEQQIFDLEHRFHLCIDHHIIMPNHCHLLITLPGASPRPTAPLSSIIGACKSITTRLANRSDGTPGRIIFQSSFHDHVIRSEADYLEHWDYIDGNPARWPEDEYYVENQP